MPRVRFIEDFDYKPTRSTTVAYKSGMECMVKRDCALRAVAAGKAVEITRRKNSSDGETAINR